MPIDLETKIYAVAIIYNEYKGFKIVNISDLAIIFNSYLLLDMINIA